MSEKLVAVPQSQLDKVEQARKELYEFAEELGWDTNPAGIVKLMRLMNITGPLWEVANRRYPEVLDKVS
jgi:hypothetical protein